MLISMQNMNFITQFVVEILQRQYILVILSTLGIPGEKQACLVKNDSINCDDHLHNTSISLLTFWRYCKDFANLLFWVLWACPAMISKNDSTNLQKTLIFIFTQKVIFITHLFLKILQRYCKLVILGPLGTLGHAHKTHQYQLVGSSNAYLQAKNQFDPSIFLKKLLFKESCNLIDQEHFGK